jgi:hypothetical protein
MTATTAPPAIRAFLLIIDTPAARVRCVMLDDHRLHIVLAGLAHYKQTRQDIFVSV